MSLEAFVFDDGHRLVAANLGQVYDAWLEAARQAAALDFVLQIKRQRYNDTVHEYLYRMTDTDAGRGNSLGRLGPRLAKIHARHRDMKAQALAAEAGRHERLVRECRQYRALRLGMISSEAAAILRLMDVYGMLGNRFMVVGTNAMAAYEIEAGARFAFGVDATEDFDLAWSSGKIALSAGIGALSPWLPERMLELDPADDLIPLLNSPPGSLRELLKRRDATYTRNTERPFQVRNASGYEVEVLLARSLADQFPRTEQLSPIPLEEQDWLLLGSPVVHVVIGRDAKAARLVVPDPRYFALQKLWLAEKPSRTATKRPKDRAQGSTVLAAVRKFMPQYPLDQAFAERLPASLKPYLVQWLAQEAEAVAALPGESERRRW